MTASRRFERADAIAALVLLLVAALSSYLQGAGRESVVHPAEHGGRLLWEIETRSALLRGVLPLWDALQFGGRPHLANAETHVWYPLHVIGRLLPLDLFCFVNVVLHAWIAGIGAYLVARQLALTPGGAFAGGAAVMLGSVLAPAVNVAHASSVFRLAWIPLAVAFAMRTTARTSLLPHAGLVLTVALAFMTASIQGAIYVLGAVGGWFIFATVWPSGVGPAPTRRLAQLGLLGCLVAGLTAIQSVPSIRLALSAPRAARLSIDDVRGDGARSEARGDRWDERLASTLAPMRRGRVVTACGGVVDAALVSHGIPVVGGHGGIVPADYARFINLVSGRFPENLDVYRPLEGTGAAPTRSDLLALLDAEYLVSCREADPARWLPVSQIDGIGIYRTANALGRAVWTCAPRAVSRNELEYRLERQRYDDTLTLHDAGPVVHLRWAAGVEESARERAEASFGIVRERFLGERTWQYELVDTSFSNIMEIVTSRLVEDTAGLDRSRFALAPLPNHTFQGEPTPEWLIGADSCRETRRATVLTKDREDGRVVVLVDAPRDGLLFLSETYSAERVAWVDGRSVEPLKVNLAFTGIPVPRGRHRVELSYDASGVRVGAGVSAFSVIVWALVAWRVRST